MQTFPDNPLINNGREVKNWPNPRRRVKVTNSARSSTYNKAGFTGTPLLSSPTAEATAPHPNFPMARVAPAVRLNGIQDRSNGEALASWGRPKPRNIGPIWPWRVVFLTIESQPMAAPQNISLILRAMPSVPRIATSANVPQQLVRARVRPTTGNQPCWIRPCGIRVDPSIIACDPRCLPLRGRSTARNRRPVPQ